MKRSLRITVGGKVQNVGLREKIKTVAEDLKVEGTAENTDAGTVIIYVSGEGEALDSLIDAIYEGTKTSVIEYVDVESNTTPRNFRGVFRVIGEDE